MDNQRRLLRLESADFLEITPLGEVGRRIVKAKSKDFTLMGICFSSETEWKKGQVLFIDYFMPQITDSIKLKMVVVWSEFVDNQKGYFCGGEIIDIETEKETHFVNYYYRRLKERFF